MSELTTANRCARKIAFPVSVLTEVADASDELAARVLDALEPYYSRPKLVPAEGKRRDGKPTWVKHEFNLFPLILDAGGVPWAEALIYSAFASGERAGSLDGDLRRPRRGLSRLPTILGRM